MTFEDWWASEYRGHTGQGYAKRAWEAAQSAEKEKRKSLTDKEITEIMLANGFTIKDGCDNLKPYVFQAVRAIERRILGEEE